MGFSFQVFEEFEKYCKEKYKSKIYIYASKYYAEYAIEKDINVCNISETTLSDFITWLRESNYSQGVINNNIMFLRAFYKFLLENNYSSKANYEYALQVKSKMLIPKYDKYYTTGEIDSLIKKAIIFLNIGTPLQFKIVTFLTYYTGITYGEINLIKRCNIDLNRKLINLPTRIIFFPEKLSGLMKLFFTLQEEKSNAFNISKENYNYYNELLLKGSRRKISFEVLRRNFIFLLQKRGIGYEALKYLTNLSHKSLEKFYDPNVFKIGKIYKKRINIK
jgi:integrase